MATAIISACLPTFRPLFMKRTPDSHANYISKDLTVDVTSGRTPSGGLQLSDRSTTYKVWAGTKAPSDGDDLDERPFVGLEGSEEASIWPSVSGR